MPIPVPALMAGLQAGSGLVNGIFGWIGQRKQRAHEQNMYNQQVATNRENWQMENQYNLPENQMQRLKDAGLNPNLAYGNYSSQQGGSIDSATPQVSNQATTLRDSFAGLSNSPINTLNSIYDLKIKDAQADLLQNRAQTEIQNEALRTFQALNETIENEKGNIDLNYYRKFKSEWMHQFKTITRNLVETGNLTRANISATNTGTQLAGSKLKGQDIANDMAELEKKLYSGELGLPKGTVDQIIKIISPLFLMLKGK